MEQFAHIRLLDNIRFTIVIIEKAHRMQSTFKANVGWWAALKSSIAVRDRLMHPKRTEDLDITGEEILSLMAGYQGLLDHYVSYPGLNLHALPDVPAQGAIGETAK